MHPQRQNPRDDGRDTLLERDMGLPWDPPVSSWVHTWNQLLSSCSSTTTAGGLLRHHPIPCGAVGRRGWGDRGWDGM